MLEVFTRVAGRYYAFRWRFVLASGLVLFSMILVFFAFPRAVMAVAPLIGPAFGASWGMVLICFWFGNSAVVVRARVLRCWAWHVGTLGSTAAPGDHWAVSDFSKSDVHRRRYGSRRLVRALGFAHSCHLHCAFRMRIPPSRSPVWRTLGGSPIRRAVAGVSRTRTSVD